MDNQIFKWNNIAINTWVAKVPNGWLIKSVDTKNEVANIEDNELENENDNNEEKKVPIAMSSSTIIVEDSTHGWNFDSFRWINISRDTWRAKVVGGWIIKTVDTKNVNFVDFDQLTVSSSMVFVPDGTHKWKLSKENQEENNYNIKEKENKEG